MKDDSTYTKLDPNWREIKILQIISNHRGINQTNIRKISKMSIDSVNSVLDNLYNQKKIEFAKVKQGEKIYFKRFSEKMPTFEENIEKMQSSFDKMKATILNSLELVKSKNDEQIFPILKICLKVIISFKTGIEFMIDSNKSQNHPKIWDELLNQANELQKQISQGIESEYLYNKIMTEFVEKNYDGLLELDWFLSSIENKQKSLKSKQKEIS